ncbi:hypothetical protein BHM03_00021672, partial [Ensete ventricosum]
VYLEIPSGEKIAQAFHSKVVFWNGVRYVIYWKSAFSSYAASYFRHALLSVVQRFVGVNFRTVSVTYRSLVTLGIASIRGTTVASFEKEDADRLLFFCRRQVKDFVSEETVVSCLPTWSSSLIKGKSMSGLESRPIASDYVFVGHGMACKSAELSVKNRQRSNIAAMRPIPHPRKHKLLPFFGVPPADVNNGSQVQNNVSQTPHVKHNSLPRAPAIQRKSTSSSLRAQQIIPLNPLPLKKHECKRATVDLFPKEGYQNFQMPFSMLSVWTFTTYTERFSPLSVFLVSMHMFILHHTCAILMPLVSLMPGGLKGWFLCGKWHKLEGTGLLKNAQPYRNQQNDCKFLLLYLGY